MFRAPKMALLLAWLPAAAVSATHSPPDRVHPPVNAPLGRIDFPVTGLPDARNHFLRGMLALHSFWYEEAADEFRAATLAAPDFAMGYWGEALTHYHPVWGQEDLA